LSDRELQYQNQITELEQQIRLLKEQVDFLTRKLYGTKSEKTSVLDIEGQMSLFNETEYFADPNAKEPELVEVEKYLRKRKYTGQREELIKDLPHSKVLHTIDESEQVCEKCGSFMVKAGEEFVRTEVQFIPASLKAIDHYRETFFFCINVKNAIKITLTIKTIMLPSILQIPPDKISLPVKVVTNRFG